MGSPRPIVCTYCKNKQKSFLFKELTDEEYDVMAERLDEFDRAAYFCMICIQKIRRKIERIKKREALLREAANPHGSEDEESYSSCEEIRQRLNAHRNQVEQQNSGQQQPEQPPPRSNSSWVLNKQRKLPSLRMQWFDIKLNKQTS